MEAECGKKAVIYRDYEGRALCEEHFIRSVDKKVKRTIRQNNLVEYQDTIAVGVSGGKDSGVLLYLLKKYFEERDDIKLKALAIDEGIKGYRDESLDEIKSLANTLDVPLTIASFENAYGYSLDRIMEIKEERGKELGIEGVTSCTFCGVLRRDILNQKARDLEADKLAIGHNLDDEVQAIMMNYMKGDYQRMARLGPKTYKVPSENFVPRIKPLRQIPERETTLYSQLKDMDVAIDECPYVSGSFRFEVRDFINEMEDRHPTTKYSILSNFDKLLPLLREKFYGKVEEVSPCERCGEPSSGDLCKKCELLESLED